MMLQHVATIAFAFCLVTLAFAAETQTPRKPSSVVISQADYPALALHGNAVKGKQLYNSCVQCHHENGSGLADGSYPQIAGQHTNMIIKQLSDIRSGKRENQVMAAIVQTLSGPQDLADVAAYIQTLKIPYDNGKGPADSVSLTKGQQLYQRDCTSCHGSFGEGNAKNFYPVIAGQHYAYVVRQIESVKNQTRKNAHPEMIKLVQNYSPEEINALANYISLLRWPERSAK